MVKNFRRYVYSFWHDLRTWQTDGQTDTAWRHRPRLCIASRGKIRLFNPLIGSSNYNATSNNMTLVHLPLMGGQLHLVQWDVDWAGPQPAQAPPRCTNRRIYILRCSAVLMCPMNGQEPIVRSYASSKLVDAYSCELTSDSAGDNRSRSASAASGLQPTAARRHR